MSENIRRMYRKAGMKPPNGKGLHTARAHRAVIWYMKKKGLSKSEAWKRVIGGMGKWAFKHPKLSKEKKSKMAYEALRKHIKKGGK